MANINELIEHKTFIVEKCLREDLGTEIDRQPTSEYKFTCSGEASLYVSGDVFREKIFLVENVNEVLFNIAEGRDTVVKCDDIEFTITNPRIRFLKSVRQHEKTGE